MGSQLLHHCNPHRQKMRIETLVVFVVILGIVATAEIGKSNRSSKSESDSQSDSSTDSNLANNKRALLRDYSGHRHHRNRHNHHHGHSDREYSKSGNSGYGNSKSYSADLAPAAPAAAILVNITEQLERVYYLCIMMFSLIGNAWCTEMNVHDILTIR